MTFGLGEGGEIFCTANAYPPANVTWERLKVNATSGVEDMGVQGLGKSHLVFPKLSTEDGGEYRCTATNKYGTVSKTTKVFVKGITGNIFLQFFFLPLLYIRSVIFRVSKVGYDVFTIRHNNNTRIPVHYRMTISIGFGLHNFQCKINVINKMMTRTTLF